jgi:hypothetical protein
MAKASAKKRAGGGPPPRRTPAPPVRSKGSQAGRRPPSRRTLLIVGVVVALAILGIVLGIVLAGGKSKTNASSGGTTIPWAQIPGLQSGPPPWGNSSAVLSDRLSLLHLDALGAEGEVIHIHQHLDIYVNGKKVQVPALVGIDTNGQFLTQLHTHDTTGILHVESPTNTSFRLGQFFGEWGVKLTANCIGSYCGHLGWWVDGKKQVGNPAQLKLAAHQEIVIASGTPPTVIPSSYKFPAGL